MNREIWLALMDELSEQKKRLMVVRKQLLEVSVEHSRTKNEFDRIETTIDALKELTKEIPPV